MSFTKEDFVELYSIEMARPEGSKLGGRNEEDAGYNRALWGFLLGLEVARKEAADIRHRLGFPEAQESVVRGIRSIAKSFEGGE